MSPSPSTARASTSACAAVPRRWSTPASRTRCAGCSRAATLRRPAQRRAEVEESLEELAGLTAAAGATVGQRVIQERQAATSSLYFGSGKVDEMAEAVRESGANLFISDDPLSPIQERNLSEA